MTERPNSDGGQRFCQGRTVNWLVNKNLAIATKQRVTMPTLLKRSQAALLLALACLHAAPGQTAQVDMTDIIFKVVEKRLIREYFATQRGDRDDGRNSRERYRTASKTSIWRVS